MATQQVQIQAGGQTIIAPAGQFIRTQNVLQASNILQNGNTIVAAGEILKLMKSITYASIRYRLNLDRRG